MDSLPMCRYAGPDGTYWIPEITAEPVNKYISLVSDTLEQACIPDKVICQEGESDCKDFSFRLGDLSNTLTERLGKIFAGIYRIGTEMPVWQQTVDIDSEYRYDVEFRVDRELPCGRYFLLLGNIGPVWKRDPTREFAGCRRMDFLIIPNGSSLAHPRLRHYSIRYIAPEDRPYERRKSHPNLMMLVGDFPVYELTIELDTVPDPTRERYDLRIFDEGLGAMETYWDILDQPAVTLHLVPPHGVPHGTSHFILYHNNVPLFHFHCTRKKRLGTLKAEPVRPDSVYYYLHRCSSLQLYTRFKRKVVHLLNHPEVPRPQFLCLIVEWKNASEAFAVQNDLYSADACPARKVTTWKLDRIPRRKWGKINTHAEQCLRNSNLVQIIQGTEEDTDLLFREYPLLNRLYPPKNRWRTGPYTPMEELYQALDVRSARFGRLPDFKEYEAMYRSFCEKF